jgi:hypothetical protein
VAYTFQGLKLDEGSFVSKLDLQRAKPALEPKDSRGNAAENAVRERMKALGKERIGLVRGLGDDLEAEMEVSETLDSGNFAICFGPERTVHPLVVEKAKGVVLHNEFDPVQFKGSGDSTTKSAGGALARSYPSINRLSDSKSRSSSKPKKRCGTPPLFGSAEASLGTNEGGHRFVDEDRAALTWHGDEITGHNPDDPEDDGEGINGIGFKPTPAMAYARLEKRRQQMAEYKNREAKEARAKRSERRRKSGSSSSKESTKEELETARRVRFLEGDVKDIILTI